jgi:carboxylesterase
MSEPAVLAGAEPFYAEEGKTGILISHGFTGNPQSMRYLAEKYAAAGYSVALPRLKGHGTTPQDMAQSKAMDWVHDLHTALEWLKQRSDAIFMTGLSMGGTLTLVMSGMMPYLFKGIIPINAAVMVNNPDLAGLAFLPGAPAEVPGVGNDVKAEGVTELAYSVVPVPALRELMGLLAAANELLPRISCPALVMTSRDDHVVPPVNGDYIMGKIGSQDKRHLWLENSYHVATLDNDKDLIVQETLRFVKTHAG